VAWVCIVGVVGVVGVVANLDILIPDILGILSVVGTNWH
jgi:hypothetical protein